MTVSLLCYRMDGRRPTAWAAALVLIWLLLLPAAAQVPDDALDAGPLLPLEEAVRIALAQNYEIRIARNRAEIARNDYSLGNAGFLPTVGLTARQSQNSLLSTGGQQAGFGGSSFDLAAGANVTVFDGLSRFAAYERLGVQERLGALEAQLSAEATLADVVIVYFDIARQQQQLDVLEETIAISEERLRIAELRRDLGSASELEVRRARVDLNIDRASRLRQEVALTNTKTAFNQLLGRERGLRFRAVETIDVDRSLAVDVLLAQALQANRDLRYAEGAREVAELSRRELRAAWWPRIDLQAGYAFNDFTTGLGLPNNRPGGFNYGLTASFNLFEGFNRERRLENARLQIANAELAREEVRTQIQTEVENAFLNYQNRLTLIALEEENEGLAEQNVEVALERFRLGTITSLELREVQTALANVESRLVTARFEAKRAEVELLQLSGRLLEGLEQY